MVGLGGGEAVEEPLDRRGRLDADELVHHPAALERLDGGDPLNPVLLGDPRVGVGVDLRQDDVALARGRRLLEQRSQRPAGATPGGPEVDDDGRGGRAVDDLVLKVGFGDVDDGHGLKSRSW